MFDCVYSTLSSLPLYKKHNGDDTHQNDGAEDGGSKLFRNALPIFQNSRHLIAGAWNLQLAYSFTGCWRVVIVSFKIEIGKPCTILCKMLFSCF